MSSCVLFVLLCVSAAFAGSCSFRAGVEYSCIPCGGTYSCHGNNVCIASSVPDCTLPRGAQEWFCCEANACDVTFSNGLCMYTAPRSPPPLGPSGSPSPKDNDGDVPVGWIVFGVGMGVLCIIVVVVVVGVIVGVRFWHQNQYQNIQPYYSQQ